MPNWLTSLLAGPPHRTRPPFADLQPTVEWQVAGHCNYDCPYCIQSRPTRVGSPTTAVVQAIIRGLAELPGRWEIKMSGGEPFAYKGFMTEVIPGLVEKTPHHLSVLTNFSAPKATLQRFSELTESRLRIVSASLHPDSVEFEEFVAKAIEFRSWRERNNPHSSFVVNVVLVPGKVAQHLTYRRVLSDHGIRYFPQLMKIKGGVYPYDDRESQLIEQLTEGSHHPRRVNRAPSYQGLHCEAGAWYFVVDQFGEAYRCRTGKRFSIGPSSVAGGLASALPILDSDDSARLGNFARGDFHLREKGGICPYSICPCTVPANRGIVRLSPRSRRATDIDSECVEDFE